MCLCREYNYGNNKIKPSDVGNSSDASSAKRNEATSKVSVLGFPTNPVNTTSVLKKKCDVPTMCIDDSFAVLRVPQQNALRLICCDAAKAGTGPALYCTCHAVHSYSKQQ